ncbi:M56 family metallopeptidase [Kitasatospora sp. NPDC051853]|uniref:M56 family metallopeptidase n=1 Tax=Kitasatospora sp. NPDC051853 TaxID=3364058 RepID=UPI0037977FAD
MGVFVFLPLILPLTALPIARLAEQHLHPRTTTRLLSWISGVLALCSTLCLGLLGVVGTAQIPGNPLPDAWADPEVRAAVPWDEAVGTGSIVALAVVVVTAAVTLGRHLRGRLRARWALAPLGSSASGFDSGSGVAVLDDEAPYAYAVPGRRGRIVVSTAMLAHLDEDEQRALYAHERAHLTGRHHRHLLVVRLAAAVNPFLAPLRDAVVFAAERWADEEAAEAVGDRRLVARAVGRASLALPRPPATTALAQFAAPGPVPRRVAALLAPGPAVRHWPPAASPAGLAALVAAAGTTVSAMSCLNASAALLLILHTATASHGIGPG